METAPPASFLDQNMSLIKCKECGHDVSSEAKNCPNCGAKPPKSVGVVGIVFAILLGVMVFQCSSSTPKNTPAAPQKSAAQLAAEKAEAMAQQNRFEKAGLVMLLLKKQARNPQSLSIEYAGTNDDGTVVCIEYRAQNGFGGMNKEIISLVGEKIGNDSKQWNKHCANASLHDLTYAKQILK